MNDAFNRSNDLQGFRAGLAEEHSQYAAGLQAKSNSYIQNLTDTREKFFGEGGPLDKAKMALGAADEMIKGGLEGEGAVAGAYMAGKTALKGYRYMKGTHTLKGDLTDKGKAMQQSAQKRAGEQKTADDDEEQGGESKGGEPGDDEGGDFAGDGGEEGVEMEDFGGNTDSSWFNRSNWRSPTEGPGTGGNTTGDMTAGGGAEADGVDTGMDGMEYANREYEIFGHTDHEGHFSNNPRDGTESFDDGRGNGEGSKSGESKFDTAEEQDTYNQTGETKGQEPDDPQDEFDDAFSGETKEEGPLQETKGGEPGDDMGGDDMGGATKSAEAGDEGADLGADEGADMGADLGAELGADEALDTAAGIFSWVPFVGEVLGAAAAIAGIGTAVAGGVEAAEAGAKVSSVEGAGDKAISSVVAPHSVALNYAGGYVAPATSTVES